MNSKLLVLVLSLALVPSAFATNVVNAKHISGNTGSTGVVEVTYDYAKDGGSTGALVLATADQDLVINRVIAKVKTGIVSTSAFGVGIGGGSSVAFVSQNYGGTATTGAVLDSKLGGKKLTSGSTIVQTLSVGAITAGKITYLIEYSKF